MPIISNNHLKFGEGDLIAYYMYDSNNTLHVSQFIPSQDVGSLIDRSEITVTKTADISLGKNLTEVLNTISYAIKELSQLNQVSTLGNIKIEIAGTIFEFCGENKHDSRRTVLGWFKSIQSSILFLIAC